MNALIRPSDPVTLQPQPRALSVLSSIPTPRIAPPPSEHCCLHSSRASLLRPNTTSAFWARTLSRAHAGTTRSARRGPCRTLRKVIARTTTKRTRCHSAVSSDDGDEGRSRSGSPSRRARQEPDSERERHLSPPLPDDRAPRGGLA